MLYHPDFQSTTDNLQSMTHFITYTYARHDQLMETKVLCVVYADDIEDFPSIITFTFYVVGENFLGAQ